MNEDRNHRTLIRLCGEDRAFVVTRPSTRDGARLQELSLHRRRAQAEANRAYEHWTREPTADAYAAFRAAQDRADAAQDQLAISARHALA